jgi:iron complex outermembrane receptor protein
MQATSSTKARYRVPAVVAAILAASMGTAHATGAADNASGPDAASTPEAADAEAAGSEIIVTGTRVSGLSAAESPAPVQILSPQALEAASGNPDLMTTLSQLIPSLTMQAFGFDMAGQTLQAKLRGLSPNHVLILVNGKRRHTTANIAVDTGSTYQGGANVDLNFIPLDAIDHVEVLTDGAAAQYGSDAIAGVINIILKKNSSGGVANGTYGQYANAGGRTEDASVNAGFEPTEGGYFSLTGDFHQHGHSNVGALDERVINPANWTSYPNSNLPNVPGYPNLNRISGDGAQQLKLAALNTGYDFADGTELYGTVTYGHKDASSFENYRLPSKADYTDALTGQAVYPYPFGFNPLETSSEDDYQLNIGVKGEVAGWKWDLATGYGSDKASLSTIHSYNTGYSQTTGLPSPENFYDGFLKTTQWATTIDINHDFDVGLASPLNLAFGGEYRRDTYAIGEGVPLSWENGGASSYPGFTPNDAGSNGRKNDAGYIDLNLKPITGLTVDAAGRFEHYTDFGDAKVGKLTARYDFTPEFALRGTVSNGFRAPTLAEEYYTSTNVGPTTAFVQLAPNSAAGKLLGLGNGLQPEHSVNLSFGAVWRPTPGMNATLDVYQITITNRIVGSGQIIGSAGTVISPVTGKPVPNIVSQVVDDAIIASGAPIDPQVVASGTTGINVFANGIDTRTRGADLTFDFPVDYGFAKVDWSIGATYTDTTITKYASTPAALSGGINPATGVATNELYDPEAYSDLTSATPKYVINLGALFTTGKLSVNLTERIFGASSEYENDDGDNGGTGAGTYAACVPHPGTLFICPGGFDYFQSRIGVTPITNLDVSYKMLENFSVSIGAINLFNRFPNKENATLLGHTQSFAYGDNAGVTQYPGFSPYGINGGFYYAKLSYKF